MSKGQQRRLAFFALGALLAYMLYQSNAQGMGLLGGVGKLMSPTAAGGGGSPVSPFSITTEAGALITTEAGSPLVTQAAP